MIASRNWQLFKIITVVDHSTFYIQGLIRKDQVGKHKVVLNSKHFFTLWFFILKQEKEKGKSRKVWCIVQTRKRKRKSPWIPQFDYLYVEVVSTFRIIFIHELLDNQITS